MYETVPVKAVRAFYIAGCCLFFKNKQERNMYGAV